MALTEEQKENLSSHFNMKIGAEKSCPACSYPKPNWRLLDDVINEDGDEPLVGVYCTNCSYTMLFPAHIAGVPVS